MVEGSDIVKFLPLGLTIYNLLLLRIPAECFLLIHMLVDQQDGLPNVVRWVIAKQTDNYCPDEWEKETSSEEGFGDYEGTHSQKDVYCSESGTISGLF